MEKIRKNKFIMVLDVEGGRTLKPYNIGYLIADRKGNIIVEKSYALPNNIWENLQYSFNSKYVRKNNITEILNDFDNKISKYTYISNKNFVNTFKQDIINYGICEIWAYNSIFDFNSINRLFTNEKMPDVKWCDIMTASTIPIMYTKKYVKFCLDNNFTTTKNNINSTAESVYAYLTKNPNFKEEHTGLADCKIEYEILLAIYKKHAKLLKDAKPNTTWKILNKIREKL